MPLIQIEASTLIIVTEDHGGYKGGRCIACGACGWINNLVHHPGCPVSAALCSNHESSIVEANHSARAALPCHGSGVPSQELENCILKAMDATVELAEVRGMYHVWKRIGEDLSLSYEHLKDMQRQMHEQPMSEGKLNRWLGWAQCAVVASGRASLIEMREINARTIPAR